MYFLFYGHDQFQYLLLHFDRFHGDVFLVFLLFLVAWGDRAPSEDDWAYGSHPVCTDWPVTCMLAAAETSLSFSESLRMLLLLKMDHIHTVFCFLFLASDDLSSPVVIISEYSEYGCVNLLTLVQTWSFKTLQDLWKLFHSVAFFFVFLTQVHSFVISWLRQWWHLSFLYQVDADVFTVESALRRNFDSILRNQLDPISHSLVSTIFCKKHLSFVFRVLEILCVSFDLCVCLSLAAVLRTVLERKAGGLMLHVW